MKKIAVSAFVIISFTLYALLNQKGSESNLKVDSLPVQTDRPDSLPAQKQTKISSTPSTTSSQTTSQYKDGTYKGQAVDFFYGTMQVEATISGGKLSDVTFLQYPNDRGESIEINTRAMPSLKQEAITAQSAQVDIVSRATDSSLAFKESLASALSQAK